MDSSIFHICLRFAILIFILFLIFCLIHDINDGFRSGGDRPYILKKGDIIREYLGKKVRHIIWSEDNRFILRVIELNKAEIPIQPIYIGNNPEVMRRDWYYNKSIRYKELILPTIIITGMNIPPRFTRGLDLLKHDSKYNEKNTNIMDDKYNANKIIKSAFISHYYDLNIEYIDNIPKFIIQHLQYIADGPIQSWTIKKSEEYRYIYPLNLFMKIKFPLVHREYRALIKKLK